jgi:hypothetical protein
VHTGKGVHHTDARVFKAERQVGRIAIDYAQTGAPAER